MLFKTSTNEENAHALWVEGSILWPFFNLSRKTASSVGRTFYQCSLDFPYHPTFVPYVSFAILVQDRVIVLDNLVIQNMLWHFTWENNKAMSIHCNTNTTTDNNRSFQFLIKLSALPKLISSFKILSDYMLDFITPQEIEGTKIRHFTRKIQLQNTDYPRTCSLNTTVARQWLM